MNSTSVGPRCLYILHTYTGLFGAPGQGFRAEGSTFSVPRPASKTTLNSGFLSSLDGLRYVQQLTYLFVDPKPLNTLDPKPRGCLDARQPKHSEVRP